MRLDQVLGRLERPQGALLPHAGKGGGTREGPKRAREKQRQERPCHETGEVSGETQAAVRNVLCRAKEK